MHENGLPIRYVGELFAVNYVIRIETFLSIRHAKEYLEDLMFACEEDSMILFKCDPSESRDEIFLRVEDDARTAYAILSRGPRGGIRLEHI